ncbi:MAG: tyrosine-type recombinase/integrase [Planctomycetes bacterium]|nr:tyrosine-type recombinase/integrase [Planctomycetota bacterium]
MIDTTKRHELQRADVERVWAKHLTASAGERWHERYIGRYVIRQFLAGVGAPNSSGTQCLVIDQPTILNWMIHDVAGKAVSYAGERLAVLDRFLKVLAGAALIGADLLAEFRVGHGRQSWQRLARALQADNPEAALAALRFVSPPPGPLTAHVRTYIDLQQALGKDYRSQEDALQSFDRFLHARAIVSLQAVTPDLLEQWLGTLTCCARSRIHKTRFVRRFFDYLQSLTVVTNNPVPVFLTSPHRLPRSTFKPFIFTQEQLAAILAMAKQLPDNHMCARRAEICSTMLTLLCALGLRHGEVQRLRLCDLQMDRQALFIARTKFHKSRYVPFGPKVGQCLERYLEVRRTLLLPVHEGDALFVTKRRKPICLQTLLAAFRGILCALGITGVAGQYPPRLHDLRHTFAVNRLLRWYRDGVDVQSRLPLLSTFLGHIDPQSTEVYLTITADLLREANVRFHRHFGSHFDEATQP